MGGREAWALEQLDSLLDFPVIVSNTKPIRRLDNGPLRQGERWYKPSDGTEWFWNGTWWLSNVLHNIAWPVTVNFGATGILSPAPNTYRVVGADWSGVFFTRLLIHYISMPAVAWDASNYTDYVLNVMSSGGNNIPIFSTRINNITNTGQDRQLIYDINYFRQVNVVIPQGAGGFRDVNLVGTKTGSGTDLMAMIHLGYRGVAP